VRIGKPTTVLKWFAVAVVVISATVGAFYLIVNNQSVKNELARATTRQPEHYTELYFAEPSKIPSHVQTGQTVPVSFVVHNIEARDMTYRYTVTYTDAAGAVTTFADNTIIISNGQLQTITHNVVVPAGTGRGQVAVQLINKGQTVHFWLERT
jgi:hypothetical protein